MAVVDKSDVLLEVVILDEVDLTKCAVEPGLHRVDVDRGLSRLTAATLTVQRRPVARTCICKHTDRLYTLT